VTGSTAILCIARNELPFTEEWLEYHFGLGFDRVYYVSTDPDFNQIAEFFDDSKWRTGIELLHFHRFEHGWQIACYNQALPLIKEDWVLVLDLDEFVYLPSFSTIREYLQSLGDDVAQIQFPWLILLSQSYYHGRVLDIAAQCQRHASDHVKSMVHRRSVSGLGVHAHRFREGRNCLSSGVEADNKSRHEMFLAETMYYREYPSILHFCSRGHYDVLNRIIDHKFFNSKAGEAETRRLSDYLRNEPDWSNVPTRYMLNLLLSELVRVDMEISLPVTEAKTDVRRLEALFVSNIRRVVDFEVSDLEATATSFEKRFQLDRKLATLNLAEYVDLHDYRQCNTQEQYIDRLRRSLEVGQSSARIN